MTGTTVEVESVGERDVNRLPRSALGRLKELLMDRSGGNTLPSDTLPPKRATFGGRMSASQSEQRSASASSRPDVQVFRS